MRRIRSADTKPEIKIRSELHKAGLRFRKNSNKILGKPDIVFHGYRTLVFVHGCFWHRHKNCKKATTPSTNREFWEKKFERNIQRDRETVKSLKKDGWKVFIIWECEVNRPSKINRLIKKIKDLKKKPVIFPSPVNILLNIEYISAVLS